MCQLSKFASKTHTHKYVNIKKKKTSLTLVSFVAAAEKNQSTNINYL